MLSLIKTIGRKFAALGERLSSRPVIGGLQIGDTALYYAAPGDTTRTLSLRLPPGVVTEGKVVDRARLKEFLAQLRGMVDSEDAVRAAPVVVVLPAADVYTQSFNLPNVGAERLGESAALNLQMLSPIPVDLAYAGWQLAAETEDHYELLGAFAEKRYVDDIRDLLGETHFYPIALEFPGLALTRLVSRVLQASERSLLAFHLSSEGINLLIFRRGALYFDYFRSWHSIQGGEKEIPREAFNEVVAQEVQKVVNFSLSRFGETPEQVVLIAPGYERELGDFIKDRFGLPIIPFEYKQAPSEPAWFVALGAALRGEADRSSDTDISLAPVSSANLFYREQLLGFIGLWRNIVGAVLSLFLLLFAGAAYLMVNQAKSLEASLTIFRDVNQSGELGDLRTQAERFNMFVATIRDVRGNDRALSGFLDRLAAVAEANHVTVLSVAVGSFAAPVSLSARAADYDSVLRFKQTLQSAAGFAGVDVPIAGLVTGEDGSVVFTMSFRYEPAAAPAS